jgi:hypothetical protein
MELKPIIRGLADLARDTENELSKVKEEIERAELESPFGKQLYAVQQSLEWVLNPSIASSPLEMLQRSQTV